MNDKGPFSSSKFRTSSSTSALNEERQKIKQNRLDKLKGINAFSHATSSSMEASIPESEDETKLNISRLDANFNTATDNSMTSNSSDTTSDATTQTSEEMASKNERDTFESSAFSNNGANSKINSTEPEEPKIDLSKVVIPSEHEAKLMQWERKLLDLSLRNALINTRIKSSVVPVLCSDISSLEDFLADGEDFSILPSIDENEIEIVDTEDDGQNSVSNDNGAILSNAETKVATEQDSKDEVKALNTTSNEQSNSEEKVYSVLDVTTDSSSDENKVEKIEDSLSKEQRLHEKTTSDSKLDAQEEKASKTSKGPKAKSKNSTLKIESAEDVLEYAKKHEEFIASESKKKNLHTIYSENELQAILTKNYRQAKVAIEENGQSSLYLALGFLKWKDAQTAVCRYAPLVLVPIEFKRKMASSTYKLHMRDEDAQVNITLIEFLKQTFNIKIESLNPAPLDEHGLDMKLILSTFKESVAHMDGWDIIETAIIGNFSFAQFVMWNDIHTNPEFLEANKVVRSLMAGKVDWDCSVSSDVDSADTYLPITVDSSQLRAINMAVAGSSFVLHGPPGTGKSQTITAMISNALFNGKKVLFVAEKMAALEVVEKRLKSLGIGDFCFELHSNKATKKSVLDQLKSALEIENSKRNSNFARKTADIKNMRSDLDAYANAIHKQRDFGKSLRELIDIYETVPDVKNDANADIIASVNFDKDYVKDLKSSDLDAHVRNLELLVAAGTAITHPHNHPLVNVVQDSYSQQIKFDLSGNLSLLVKELQKEDELGKKLLKIADLEEATSLEQWNELQEFAKVLILSKEIPDFIKNSSDGLNNCDLDKEFLIASNFLEKKEALNKSAQNVTTNWNANFLRLNMQDFKNKYEAAKDKFFLFKGKALKEVANELQQFANFTVDVEKIPVYLNDIDFYQKDLNELNAIQKELPMQWQTVVEKCSSLSDLNTLKVELTAKIQQVAKFNNEIANINKLGEVDNAMQLAEDFLKQVNITDEKEKSLQQLLKIDFSIPCHSIIKNNQQELITWPGIKQLICNNILTNESSLKDWITYKQIEKDCLNQGLKTICDAYNNGLAHQDVLNVYLREMYKAIILFVIAEEPSLNSFTGTSFNEKVIQFNKLDEEIQNLTKIELYNSLLDGLPSEESGNSDISKELTILRRAIRSNGRGLSVRTLFEQIPHVLTKLCPCMLMSPISVAQYLKPENNLFDLVIFDEASQLPTCKAVGVIARAKNTIVVGDPNQMPPTSFFSSNKLDEENLEIEDLDSILDDCLALGMPSSYLRWHYRSRHESLIAFSNQEFYESSMFTFPSKNDLEKKVVLHKVEGFFDRGGKRVNVEEAKAIVKEIYERYKNEATNKETVGVVTFNESQQSLIEDLLQEEFNKDVEFDKWANMREETLFVKNLENVQGDERDVILFSIAFGPDKEGKLSLNFGPINKDGGWKRLNVAVTRARSEMVVFSTLTADMIDLKRTKSKGVEALKHFLSFAQNGVLIGENTHKSVNTKQGIMEKICKAIKDAGFDYQKGIGHSRFKIDIGVINPKNPKEYLLGILLDGDSYAASKNTKDREIAQKNVLKRLGWNLERVWTMDWWDSSEKELDHLRNILAELAK